MPGVSVCILVLLTLRRKGDLAAQCTNLILNAALRLKGKTEVRTYQYAGLGM